MQDQCFAELFLDGVQWVQRGHRLLEDHRDIAASHAADIFIREGQQVIALQQNPPANDAAGRVRDQAQYGKRAYRFATAGLTDNGDGFPFIDGIGNPVNRFHRTCRREELRLHILHF